MYPVKNIPLLHSVQDSTDVTQLKMLLRKENKGAKCTWKKMHHSVIGRSRYRPLSRNTT